MPSKSKIKGSAGERELAKIFSDVFGGSFARVPTSGAMVGGSNVHRLATLSETQGRAFRGDIIPPDFLPNLYLECKSIKDFRFHQLMQPDGCAFLDSWISQTLEGIKPTDVWFICFKATRIGWYIAIPETECSGYKFKNHCVYKNSQCSVKVTDLVSFLSTNHKAILKKAATQNISAQA